MSTVTQEFRATGDNQVASVLRKMAQDYGKLEEKVQKLTTTSVQGGRDAARQHSALDDVLTGQIRTIGSLGASWLSVQGIIRAVNADFDRTIRLQDEAAGATKNLASAQANLFINTYSQDAETQQKYRDAATSMSLRYGIKEHEALGTLNVQAGRGEGISADQVIAATDIASAATRHNPEQRLPLASLIQQIMRVSGKDVRWSAALALSGAEKAYPADPMMAMRGLHQSVTAGLAHVNHPTAATVEQIMEQQAWLTQAGGEERGEEARTAQIRTMAQAQEFREGRGPWARHYKGHTQPGRKVPEAPEDPISFMRWLHANPKEEKRFFGKFTAEAHYEGIIRRGVMDPESEIGKLLAANEAGISSEEKNLDRLLSNMEGGTPQIARATQAARGEAAAEQFKARYDRGAVTSNIRKMRDEALAAASRFRSQTGFEVLLEQGVQGAAGYLTNRQAEYYQTQIRDAQHDVLQGGRVFRRQPEQLAGEERKVYELLQQLYENAKLQLAELKDQHQRRPAASPAIQMQRGTQVEK